MAEHKKIEELENRLKLAVGTKCLNGWFLHVMTEKTEGVWNSLFSSSITEYRFLILMKEGIVYRMIAASITDGMWLPGKLRVVKGLCRVGDTEEVEEIKVSDRVAQWQTNVNSATTIDKLTPMMQVFQFTYMSG